MLSEMPIGHDWANGLMDMTSVYETEDCRFEPCFAHSTIFFRGAQIVRDLQTPV